MGEKGSEGIPGKIGPRGYKGSKGETGSKGVNGAGIPGFPGPRGPKGYKGERGIGTKGQKGDGANFDPRQLANWKQCAWNSPTDTDSGKIKECSFNKLHQNTALKVSYQGNIRLHNSNVKCKRWYFKFNGNECSGPLPIDSVLFTSSSYSSTSNIHRPHFFEGFCENLPQETIRIELWVGKCSGGWTLGPSGPPGRSGDTGEKGRQGDAGSPGKPGSRGPRGHHGLTGEKGEIGSVGEKGREGIPGKIGPRGYKGSKGETGSKGMIGTGIPGMTGPRGPKGLKGERGIGIKGERGDAANIDPKQLANWKQCAWKGETDADSGKIK
ncbi:Collagen triple helix repeat-containing protein 1, partial [Stylophora pistillata]